MEFNSTYEWNYLGWKEFQSATSLEQRDWNQTLITRINQAAAQIGKDTYRGTGNVLHMHPKTFTIMKTLEYYDASSNTLSGRFAIVVNDKLPTDKIYVKLDFNRHKSLFTLNENQIFVIRNSNDMNEIKLTIVDIGSEKYEELEKDPKNIFITDKLCTAEITILNHRTIDPVTGEILIDYHTEIPQDIWFPSPRPDEKELSDLVMIDEKAIPSVIEDIKSSVLVNTEKPWYKRIFDFFKPKEQVTIKNVKNSKININIK